MKCFTVEDVIASLNPSIASLNSGGAVGVRCRGADGAGESVGGGSRGPWFALSTHARSDLQARPVPSRSTPFRRSVGRHRALGDRPTPLAIAAPGASSLCHRRPRGVEQPPRREQKRPGCVGKFGTSPGAAATNVQLFSASFRARRLSCRAAALPAARSAPWSTSPPGLYVTAPSASHRGMSSRQLHHRRPAGLACPCI